MILVCGTESYQCHCVIGENTDVASYFEGRGCVRFSMVRFRMRFRGEGSHDITPFLEVF